MTDNITLPRATVQQALEALLLPSMKTQQMLIQRDEAIIALRRALAEPEQEPVAWMHPMDFGRDARVTGKQVSDEQLPLYTTPPQRKPLTIAEVEQILAQHSYELHGDRARYIVRMTEEAHGIKENT